MYLGQQARNAYSEAQQAYRDWMISRLKFVLTEYAPSPPFQWSIEFHQNKAFAYGLGLQEVSLMESQDQLSCILENYFQFASCRPTVCVTGAGAGVDSVWEQRKLEARKLLENAAESPASSARCVGRLFERSKVMFEHHNSFGVLCLAVTDRYFL